VTTKNFTPNRATQSHEGHTPYFIGVLSRMSRFVRDKEGQKSRIVPLSRMSRCADSHRKSINRKKENAMNTLTKYFTDKLRAAAQFFRRPAVTTEAVEPPAAGTMNWLSPPSGVARRHLSAAAGQRH
jgi:hypothetical protein